VPEDVYGYAVFLLSKFGDYSEKNLREKMKRKTDNQQWIDQSIEKLIEQGYQSDARYAEMIVRKGTGPKAWGKGRIEQEMKRKGLDSETIKEALTLLADDDPLERAKEALDRKFQDRVIEDQKDRAKATRFLAARGFGFGSITAAIDLHNRELSD
jgi:regulatory protein